MFNKKLKTRVKWLEATLMSQHVINEDILQTEKTQHKINKTTFNAIKSMKKEMENLYVRIEILEKKLEERNNVDECDSLEDDLDRNGGTISDEC